MIVLPLVLLGAAGGAGYFRYRKKKQKKLTPDQEKIYSQALKSMEDPSKLNALAEKFEELGYKHQAEMLRKRAKLRALPPDVKAKRKKAFKDGMKLTDPLKVKQLADLFEKEGAVGSADKLRQYAKGLVQKKK